VPGPTVGTGRCLARSITHSIEPRWKSWFWIAASSRSISGGGANERAAPSTDELPTVP
jgi:hypothetical protein